MRLLCCLLVCSVLGCSADPDGDGLSSADEKALGLDPRDADTDGDGLLDGDEAAWGADPLVPDTDGDGLSDGDEVALGADPTRPDTDRDGYRDGDEVTEGSDPTDRESKIYVGGWPYVSDKDAIGGAGEPFAVGSRFDRFRLVDQHGDTVDLYDFYGSDEFVVIDVSAMWCGPCNEIARWLSGELSVTVYWDDDWPGVRPAFDEGRIRWITVLTENQSGAPAGVEAAAEWDATYPDRTIPVLGDTDADVFYYLGLSDYPTLVVLDSELVIQTPVDRVNPWQTALGWLTEAVAR